MRKAGLLLGLLVFLCAGVLAQQHRFSSSLWSVLDDEKCDGSVDIEIIRYKGGHKWGKNKTIYLQFKNSSGHWEDLVSIKHHYTSHNTYQARQVGSYWISFENRNPDGGYDYYAYKITVHNAPNPNNSVSYRWIQKEDNDYLSDTKYIRGYKPKAVTVSAQNATACGVAKLSWEKPSNVDGAVDYLIYRRKKGYSYWYYQKKQSSRTYTDSNTGNYIYEYKVVPDLSCGNRGFDSEPVEGHGILPIDAPESFEAAPICETKVKLTWRKPLLTPDSYQIQFADNSSFQNAQEVIINNGQIVEKDVEVAQAFRTYYFRIRSKNECDAYGSWSETASSVAYDLPDSPHNLSSELLQGENAFLFTWDDVSNEESYILRRVNKEDASDMVDFKIDQDETSYKDKTVKFCTSYRYTLYSYRDCGEVRGESIDLTLTPDLSTYLANLDISKGYYSDRIELSWEVPSNRTVSEVRIYRSRKGESNKELLASLESRQRSWTDYKSEANVLYEYQLVGVQFCGESTVETNTLTEVGFRMPFGTVYGNVSFEGGNPVPNAEVVAEPVDNNGLIGHSTHFAGNSYIEIPHQESFSELSQLTVQMFVKPEVSASATDEVLLSCLDEVQHKGFEFLYNAGANQLKAKIGNGSSFQTLTADVTIPHDAFSFVALSVSTDSILIFKDENKVASVAINSQVQISNQPLSIGGEQNSRGYAGLIDEFAFYSQAKTAEEIKIDYNRKLSADEDHLLVYFQMDEGVGDYAYDSSKTGRDFNKNHGAFSNVVWSNVIPSMSQLEYKALTDADGNYTLSFIKYTGRGQVFNITPIKDIHSFLPSQKRQFLGEGTEYVSIDFKDVSSFRVTGRVLYTLDDSNYPAKGIRLTIDGQIVTNKGRVVETDSNGEFDIQVPIGEHILGVEKENHYFEASTFPASGEPHDFRENITGIEFKDTTAILVAGRVVGGRIEGDKIIGFGLSQNNIGQATISFQSEQDDRYRKQVTTDPNTGEYEVKLLPINTIVTDVSVNNPDVLFKSEAYSDILKLGEALIKKEEKKQEFEDKAKTIVKSEEIYKYNYKKNFIYRAIPSLALHTSEDEDFDGETKMSVLVNRQTNQSIEVDVSNHLLGYPILFSDKQYNLKIKAFEQYTNPNLDPVVTSYVPVTDGTISIVNGLGDSEEIANNGDTESLELNDQSGEVAYNFVSKKPTLLTDTEHPSFSFTETLKITLEAGGNISEWKPDGDFFRAYLVGSKTKGKGFVTTGPETVKWILHDPPGSNSSTFIESGSTMTKSTKMTFHQDLTNDLNTVVSVGPEIVVGGGLLGPQVKTETKSDLSILFNVAQSAGRNDIDVTTVTFNNRIETSSDPDNVGSGSDLFVGYADNIIYGEAEAFNLIPVSQIENGGFSSVGNVVQVNGVDYKLAKSPSFYINTHGFNTMFIYSQYHIENVLIPELKELRNSMFTRDDHAYVSKLPVTNDKYGINNDDPLWQANASTEDPLVTEVADYDGPSYTYNYQNHEGVIDSVRWYNQQIRLWTESLKRSEKEKVETTKVFNDNSSNISFVGGGQSYEGTKTIETENTVEVTWDLALETGFAATFGAKINKTGVINTNTFAVKLGGGGEYTTTNTTSNTYGFTLSDGDIGDSFTVDILDPETDSGPVFRLRAGRSSCPFEGPEETKYYQSGTIFNHGTQQREKANLEVTSSSIVDHIPGHQPAIFTLNMGNPSETDDGSWFGLRVVEGSNPHGAAVKLNGGILSTPMEIQGGANTQVQISVRKNPKYDDYEDIKIMMYSTCEFDNYVNYESDIVVADTITISAFFIPSCGDLSITKPQDNWVVNIDSHNEQEIEVEGLGTIDENFKSLIIQYRPEGTTTWINLQKYVSNSSLLEEDAILIEAGTETIKYTWETEQVNEGAYELRLLSTCKSDITNETSPLRGTIDREAPEIFGSVSPEDGVLNAGEVVRFTFNEDLRTELISKQNIKVRGILNGGELTHSVAAYFDGVDNNMLIRTNGQSYSKSFTIEFWAKRIGDGKQVIFSQASHSDLVFEIGFDENNQMKVITGNESLLVPGEVTADKWYHWAFSYDTNSKLFTIFKNDEDAARKILTHNITRVDDIRIGKASSGTAFPFEGSMHELRIWNKALTRSQIASKMSARLSGNEIDLQGLWRIDEGQGNICIDEVRSRNAAFNAEWEISPKGKSAEFTGSATIQVKSDKFAFSSEDDFTISFWFYTAANSAQSLFANGDGLDENDLNEWNIAMDAGGKIVVSNKGVTYRIDSKSFNDGKWHHFAMVVRNPGATNFIIDGNNELSISSTEVGGLAGSYFWLGALGGINEYGEVSTSNYMRGNMDEFRIWKYARTQKIIQRDMQFRMPDEELGLVAYLPFERYVVEQNIATLEDSFDELSGNNAQVVHTGIQLAENVPNIKLPRAVENVNFNLLKSERELVVQLDEELNRIERCNIDVSVFDVLDLQNNLMSNPYTHTIRVDQNQLRWDKSNLHKEFSEYEDGEFTVEIINTGIQAQSFSISNLPTWMEVRPQAGTIEGGQAQQIQMIIHSGLNVGYYSEQIYLRGNELYNEPLFLDVAIQANKPDWDQRLGNYEYSMNIIGRLIVSDIPSTDENDMLAAYVGNELRGYARVSYQKAYDNYEVYLSVGSNKTSGETVSFKIWDASTGLVYPVEDITYAFVPDEIKGSVSSPVDFRTGSLLQRDIALTQGWNWISINLRNSNDRVSNVFANMEANDGDRIVAQNSFYQYNSGSWSGSSDLIDFTSMYKVFVDEDTRLRIAGVPVDPVTTEISLEEGWNWISYTPQFNGEINEAMSLYEAQDNDEIKTMNKFARYDEQTRRWYGSLTHLTPGEGYQLKTSAEASLYYPEHTSFSNTKSEKAGEEEQIEPEKSILLVNSNKNMTLVAVLQDEYGHSVDADKINAYLNGKAVSITRKVEDYTRNRDLYFITIPGEEENDLISFKFQTSDGMEHEVNTQLDFYTDNSMGTVQAPEILEVDAMTHYKSQLSLYPNPVSTELHVKLDLDHQAHVTLEVVNLEGKFLYVSDIGIQDEGLHQFDLNEVAEKLKSGIYILLVKIDNDVLEHKFIEI